MSDRWRVLPRNRLLRCLEEALPTGVALIVAPLGSGKTTLLEQWSGRSTRPVHWVDTSGPINLHPLTVAMSASTDTPGSMTVVIDDAHGLASHDIEVVEHFIERSTPHATILVASRTMPAFNLAHREFPTPVLITGEALRFRPREVAALFRDVYGTTLHPAAAAQLAHDTDGWAAALHLHHLGQSSRTGRPGSATASRTMNDLYLQDYLSREVLRPLPPPLVDFLRLTSVFDTVTPGRCDELLGWTGSRKVLMELTRREGLVRRDPFDPECFHHNPVLRDHLRAQLHEHLGGETVRTVRALAIDVLVRAQAPGEEATARARAADWPGLSSLPGPAPRPAGPRWAPGRTDGGQSRHRSRDVPTRSSAGSERATAPRPPGWPPASATTWPPSATTARARTAPAPRDRAGYARSSGCTRWDRHRSATSRRWRRPGRFAPALPRTDGSRPPTGPVSTRNPTSDVSSTCACLAPPMDSSKIRLA